MTRFGGEDGTMTQCGSPLWMSPEMIRNDPYDEKRSVTGLAFVRATENGCLDASC
jgi:hypothetical protein